MHKGRCGTNSALLAALDKAEAEREEVCRQMEVANQEIASAAIKRPTAAQVQEAWGGILRIWEVLTEEDREELLGSFVQAVEVTEKEEVILELLPVSLSPPPAYSKEFKLNSQMGAGRLVVVNYPPIQFPDFEVQKKVEEGCRKSSFEP